MALKEFKFGFGTGTQSVMLPEEHISDVIEGNPTPAVDVKEATIECMRHPIGSAPLQEVVKKGDKVCIVCADVTRTWNHSDQFVIHVVNELNLAGIPDEDITIVFAQGTHRAQTHEEDIRVVGEEVAGRIRLIQHDSRDKDGLTLVGTTKLGTPVWINKHVAEADKVILVNGITTHLFAGYGGGRKAVLPGCAAMETVRKNHSYMLEPTAGLGITIGNPCYEDQMEGVSLFARGRSLFLFNAILNAKHEFLSIFAGDWRLAHKEACRFVDRAYGCVIPKEADLVIASCGGYPKDINVYQMQKTMDNAACAVREGGVVVLLAECEEGSGSAKLEETFRRLVTPEAIRRELEENFQIGANKAFAISRPQSKARFILVTKLDRDLAKSMLFTAAVDSVEEALAIAKTYVGEHPSVILMPEGSLTVPRVG